MSWWSRLTGGKSENSPNRQRVDYLSEALALERQGDLAAALTSYRLALRDKPDDHRVLQNMAIAYSRMGQLDEAIRCYRKALDIKPKLSGAHYGLAYLLLKRGHRADAAEHLEAFLSEPPASAEAERWVRHARETLASLRAGDAGIGGSDVPGGDVPGGDMPEGGHATLDETGYGPADLGQADLRRNDLGQADLRQGDMGHTDARPRYER